MLKQLHLNAVNAVIVKAQSYLFSIYKEENIVMTMTIQQIDKTMRGLSLAEVRNVEKLEAAEIVTKFG